MMTCVSERSGIASSGMRRMDQTAATMATAARIRTTNLLRADHSITCSITPPGRGVDDPIGSPLTSRSMLAASVVHALDRRLQTALGIDQKVAAGDNILALGQAVGDFIE